MKKKTFRIRRVKVEEAIIKASSKEVAQELLDMGAPVGWKYLPEETKTTIEEVVEDDHQ